MHRWLKYPALILLTGGVASGVYLASSGSKALVHPARRTLQDYHRDILSRQADHGLIVEDLGLVAGTPTQIYRPSMSPGVATKSRALRAELRRRGIAPPAWGDTPGTIVLLHGRNGRKEDHLPVAERFCAAGFACVSLDLPGHGEHPSDLATFGPQEVPLLPKILTEIRKSHALPTPTALFGISQGGCIALQAAAAQPGRYFAVASVSTFADLGEILDAAAKRHHPAIRPISGVATRLVRFGTWCRAGFDPATITPADSAAMLTIPVFIGHGGQDAFIPPDHATRSHDAVPHARKSMRIVPDGTHGNVLAKGGNAFYADMAGFFLTHLPTS